MAPRSDDLLRVRDRVKPVDDLPGVPAGTPGRVILVNGLEWMRYRVLFETDEPNGTDVGALNRDQLILVDRKGEPIPLGE